MPRYSRVWCFGVSGFRGFGVSRVSGFSGTNKIARFELFGYNARVLGVSGYQGFGVSGFRGFGGFGIFGDQ